MPVETPNKDYTESLEKWAQVRDCIAGAKAVKDKSTEYLPNPNIKADDQADRYAAYIFRAVFVNATGRTKRAMVGMAFKSKPTYEIPPQTEYLLENATGKGTKLAQLAKTAVGELLVAGRFGLLADYPLNPDKLSSAQIASLGYQARIKTYKAEDIINWETDVVGGESKLVLVVLREEYQNKKDDFTSTQESQYLVLRLREDGYTAQTYREGNPLDIEFYPRQAKGSRFSEIPFIIAGTYSNDPDVDDAGLYDISVVNLAHYRNSADYEEGIFLTGQPMLHIDTGTMNADDWKSLNPNGVQVGARRGITTNGGGSVTLIQAQANSAAEVAMDKKEDQLVALGARLIRQGGQAETAYAVAIKHASDNSVLTDIVDNVGMAIKQAVEWCGLFMGANAPATYELNKEFYDKSKTPQEVMADLALFDRRVLAMSDLRNNLRENGVISPDRTDQDIDGDLDEADPTE